MSNFQLNKKRIVLNTFFLYAKTFTTMIISLFSTRLVLEALGKMDFGIYGTVAGAIAMMEALNLSMAEATQRFINRTEKNTKYCRKRTGRSSYNNRQAYCKIQTSN